jgi:hypothetical protein
LAQRPKLNLTSASDPITPPADPGRLWYDDEISAQFFGGRVTVRWVREHLPRAKGLKIGRVGVVRSRHRRVDHVAPRRHEGERMSPHKMRGSGIRTSSTSLLEGRAVVGVHRGDRSGGDTASLRLGGAGGSGQREHHDGRRSVATEGH